ncbi:MAG: hypothetical protein H8E14_14015 [Candidatus Marinimicrobia bacterium]|nr:hypothetical protein [Candidatus Neomarinimicrobiota bacterium]
MIDVYEEFRQYKVVRREEIIRFFTGNVEKANNSIRWLVASGKAQRIKPGLLYLRQPNEWGKKEVSISPWLVAARSVDDAVIAFHSALAVRGEAYSDSSMIQMAVGLKNTKKPNSFTYQGKAYTYYRENLDFGLMKKVVDDVKIQVFDPERIVLEGLKHSDRYLGMDEFLQGIEGIGWLDLSKLMQYLDSYYESNSMRMRLGWLLELKQAQWYVKPKQLKRLEKTRPLDPVYLVSSKRSGNYRVARWNLMIPKNLKNRRDY